MKNNLIYRFNALQQHTVRVCAMIAFSAVLASSSFALGSEFVRYETLALSGEVAPGTGGAIFGVFGGPIVNDNGSVVFRARLLLDVNGADSTNDEGVWRIRDAAFDLIARRGSAAPGTVGATFRVFATPRLNENDQIAFAAWLNEDVGDATAGRDKGVWGTTSNGLVLIAREGFELPGIPGSNNGHIGLLTLDDQNHTAFITQYDLPGIINRNGIWGQSSTGPGAIYQGGDEPPGAPGQQFVGFTELVKNRDGELAFVGEFIDDLESRRNGVFGPNGVSSQIGSIALEGESAPGIPGSVFGRFQNFGNPLVAVNAIGETVFEGKLEIGPGGVDGDANGGIWANVDAGNERRLVPIAIEGRATPGIPDGEFKGLFGPTIDEGRIGFRAQIHQGGSISNSNDFAIFVSEYVFSPRSGLRATTNLIAQEGDQAPGTDGLFFDNVLTSPLLNSNGDAYFLAKLRPTPEAGNLPTRALDAGLFVHLADTNEVVTIAYEGGELEVGPGDIRTIASIEVSSYRQLVKNKAGQTELAFTASFEEGGNGIFRATLGAVPVPEPSSIILALAATLMFGWRRRRFKMAVVAG